MCVCVCVCVAIVIHLLLVIHNFDDFKLFHDFLIYVILYQAGQPMAGTHLVSRGYFHFK